MFAMLSVLAVLGLLISIALVRLIGCKSVSESYAPAWPV